MLSQCINVVKSNVFDFRPPNKGDGKAVNDLISQCPPLDINSMYCNLLQCEHFSQTSVVAMTQGQLVGFISGYIIPDLQDTLFIWQVAVDKQARGCGLAKQMLNQILSRESCEHIAYLQTSITSENEASWALFGSLANELRSELSKSILFEKDSDFAGLHETEKLVTIGPIKKSALEKTQASKTLTESVYENF